MDQEFLQQSTKCAERQYGVFNAANYFFERTIEVDFVLVVVRLFSTTLSGALLSEENDLRVHVESRLMGSKRNTAATNAGEHIIRYLGWSSGSLENGTLGLSETLFRQSLEVTY